MCRTCKDIDRRLQSGRPLTEVETRQYLTEISDQLDDGRRSSHFDRVLDSILGTQAVPADQEMDAAWEAARA